MLTRLKINGFKNLVDVDIRFGAFTCIAGVNGVGKSNLFDAIKFLSDLAGDTLINAALSVRDEGGKTTDIRSLFHRAGDMSANKMSFDVEMIIPPEGVDDLGQIAKAGITFLRYRVELTYRKDARSPSLGSLEILLEELEHINLGDAPKKLRFPHTAKTWRKSVLHGRRTAPFISTSGPGDSRIIKLRQDGTGGRPKSFLAKRLPKTVLSTVNATESPTALLARNEMQSWKLLQLEPSSLREPDKFTTHPGLGSDGSHLPATLDYLARSYESGASSSEGPPSSWIYNQIAESLSELIDDIYSVHVDRDDRRELLTLEVTDHGGSVHPARSLSDGSLRFLALAVLGLDPEAKGLICLEEPENGIHPRRIPAMLRLLKDFSMDLESPMGLENPLRQVIVNTHSPPVVSQVDEDSLLVAELRETIRDGRRFKKVRFAWLPDTWRHKADPDEHPVAKGKILTYLNPVARDESLASSRGKPKKNRRVVDRPDLQRHLPFKFES